MAKRLASSDLNHDNWDKTDEPEEAGTFSKASDETLKKRVIKVARRRNPIAFRNEEEKSNAFDGFSGFEKAPPASSTGFAFLTNIDKNIEAPRTNGTSNTDKDESEKSLDEYYAKLKGLNESVTEWITTHVTANPFINLQPVFHDYSTYISELEKLKSEILAHKVETITSTASGASSGFSFSGSAPKFALPTTTVPSFSFATTSNSLSFTSSTSTSTVTSNESPTTAAPGFSFGNPTSAGSAKFSFTSTVVKPAADPENDEDDAPPKVEFTPVTEEGHSYTTRCKVFVMKSDKNYGDHGVGTLYLKPVADGGKTQLFVRAETNLGKLLCNFILSEGIPLKRMGKKDVMLVCVPTPDASPPPVPVLLRVKSPEEADELFKVLQKHRK